MGKILFKTMIVLFVVGFVVSVDYDGVTQHGGLSMVGMVQADEPDPPPPPIPWGELKRIYGG